MAEEDRHVIIDGARWHWPMQKEPTKCGVPGCDRVLSDATKAPSI